MPSAASYQEKPPVKILRLPDKSIPIIGLATIAQENISAPNPNYMHFFHAALLPMDLPVFV
jgi:hypothetical protein